MSQIGKHLTSPFFLLLVLTGLTLANLWRKRRERRLRLLTLTLPYLALVALSLPVTSHFALRSLEGQYPPLGQRPPAVQAIVVLGGSQFGALSRCARAGEVYHQGSPCPVVCSSSASDTPYMRQNLLRLGVPDRDLLEESDSHNTFDNAVHCRALLGPRHLDTIALVTDAAHMPRAAACFRKQGFAVVPAGLFFEPEPWPASLREFLPAASAARSSEYAAQEWLGMAWYWLRGRL
jgi:uncharacterized SAM-binding protein YcdF (DUF218 family)